jgi:hypothetical protein
MKYIKQFINYINFNFLEKETKGFLFFLFHSHNIRIVFGSNTFRNGMHIELKRPMGFLTSSSFKRSKIKTHTTYSYVHRNVVIDIHLIRFND